MDALVGLYGMFVKDKGKGKERFDIILEPMQAMTQIALISFCPKGSKLSITNNLLLIQTPTWIQGITRSYNHDRRDDLFFLFNAIVRFNKFYSYMKNKTGEENKLYELILKLSKKGIDSILQTYASSDQPSLLHTLQMYRTMLDRPEIFTQEALPPSSFAEKNIIVKDKDNRLSDKDKSSNRDKNRDKDKLKDNDEDSDADTIKTASSLVETNINNSNKDIDDVFIKIRQIYSKHEFSIIYNNLLLLEKRPEHYEAYIQGINASMMPINLLIKKWVNDNIVY
jgi:hypothetical protein